MDKCEIVGCEFEMSHIVDDLVGVCTTHYLEWSAKDIVSEFDGSKA